MRVQEQAEPEIAWIVSQNPNAVFSVAMRVPVRRSSTGARGQVLREPADSDLI